MADSAENKVEHQAGYVAAWQYATYQRIAITPAEVHAMVKAAAPAVQANVLHHAASCMKDPEDAAWLTSWAAELEEQS